MKPCPRCGGSRLCICSRRAAPRCSFCGCEVATSYGAVAFCARCIVKAVRRSPPAAKIPDSPVGDDRTDSSPDRLTGKIIGFRGWTLDGYRLKSSNANAFWKIGVNRARCLRDMRLDAPPDREPHTAPAPGCKCGLYCLHEPAGPDNFGFMIDDPAVWGAVTAWGRIEVHAQGFRAEYAEPVVLAYDPRQAYEDVIRAQTMAAEFGLPFVTLDELPAEAAKHGQVVPEDMRPEGLSAFDAMLQSFSSSPHFASGGAVGVAQWSQMGQRTLSLARELGKQNVALVQLGLTQEQAARFVAGLAEPSKPRPTRPVTNLRQRLKTVGPPYHGKYREGDLVADRKGRQWVCVKGGKPGSWTAYEPET